MALKYECDSCGALATPNRIDDPPDDWVTVVITGTLAKNITLCTKCAAIPMKFGNVTYEFKAEPRPRAMLPTRR